MIVTGGIAPNNAGRVAPFAAMMTSPSDAARHKEVVAAVHQHHDAAGNGPRIAMQILHAGRYGYHPWLVGPTNVKAPIGWFTPTALSEREIEATIGDFVRSAQLAEEAGLAQRGARTGSKGRSEARSWIYTRALYSMRGTSSEAAGR